MSDEKSRIPIDPDLSPSDPGEPVVGRSRRSARRRFGRAQPDVLAVIAIGGMLGAAARFKLAEALPTNPGHFPWATFWTNLSGSFVLGFLLIVLLERFPPTRYVRPFVATGILGAYTTMSTFTVETALLIKDDHAATAVLYGLGSVAAGVFLAYAGIAIARLTVAGASHR
ncbi:MAG: fluoride efflux transporter CrcB [Ilumatobacteraceae bacterium]|nr:fluoride efflux transporter CrcB [Ilumatobacteraceae bacterium]